MFWKREDKTVKTGFGEIPVPKIPARPIFVEMLELLRDAEKFDNQGYKDSCKTVLNRLSEVAKNYDNED